MISSPDPEQPNSVEPEEQQDDEIIATVFRRSLQVFALIAVLGLGIWWLTVDDEIPDQIEQGKQVPILARDIEETAPVLSFTDDELYVEARRLLKTGPDTYTAQDGFLTA